MALSLVVSCAEDIRYISQGTSLEDSDDDGAWSSSGGGDFLGNQHNPWFMGKDVVKWCINHGGPENFSLGFDDAKKSIELVLNDYAEQIRHVQDLRLRTVYNTFPTSFDNCTVNFLLSESSFRNNQVKTYCKEELRFPDKAFYDKNDLSFDPKNALMLSEKFEYSTDCQEADLEFNLGNIHDSKIKKLIKMNHKRLFRLKAGDAIRTHYDENKKRGKGFIYIAPDKGAMAYAGPKSGDNFWSHLLEKLKSNTPYDIEEVNQFFDFDYERIVKNLEQETILDKYSFAFDMVLAHELGHIFGFRHSTRFDKSLMNLNFPSSVVEGKFFNITRRARLKTKMALFGRGSINLFKKDMVYGYQVLDERAISALKVRFPGFQNYYIQFQIPGQ